MSKTIWIRVRDGKNVSACSTKAKALARIKDGDPDMSKKEAQEILNDEWQEVYLD